MMGEKFAWGDHRLEPIHLAGWGLHQNPKMPDLLFSDCGPHYEDFHCKQIYATKNQATYPKYLRIL